MQVVLDTADKLKKGGKGLKKMVKKAGASEDVHIETTQPIRNQEEISVSNEEAETVHHQELPVHNEEYTTNQKVHQYVHDSIPSPPLSPTTKSCIPITISLCPPPIISSQPTSVPISTPILTTSTTDPISSTVPDVTINVSDTGAITSVFTTSVSLSIYCVRTNDPDMNFDDGDEDDLGGFTYSPFQIQTDSEDEAQL
ncbi:unnamed protein product [Lactuca saligna]|uniref:Uncharacterized protein n=1 Tax=Lactuca saligna TaxID=75948 RepID=A0AA35Y3I0_LACSI|nr:unnamed protein product [Lactuca saligna]